MPLNSVNLLFSMNLDDLSLNLRISRDFNA